MTNKKSGAIITMLALSGHQMKGGEAMVQMTLEAARVNVGLTQKEAAEKLGVSNKTLGNWENGITFPPADMIPKICDLYGVSYDHINFLPKCSL